MRLEMVEVGVLRNYYIDTYHGKKRPDSRPDGESDHRYTAPDLWKYLEATMFVAVWLQVVGTLPLCHSTLLMTPVEAS
jgi:hypothetical protein